MIVLVLLILFVVLNFSMYVVFDVITDFAAEDFKVQ